MQMYMTRTGSQAFSWRKLFIVFLVVLFVGIGSYQIGYDKGEERGQARALGAGVVSGKGTPPPEYLSNDVDFSLFWEVWQLLEANHLERPLSQTKLFYGALAGLVEGVGDPYTSFLDPKSAEEFSAELAGSFEGIGAEIGIRSEQLVIIAPLDNTPAARAGVQAGDYIRAIDGTDTAGMGLFEAVSRIRGPRGSTVTLRLERNDGDRSVFDVSVVRDTITIESVSAELLSSEPNAALDIAYVKISHFNEDTVADFNETVDSLLAKNPTSFILDLRNNPGGFLDGAVAIASYWVENDVVVIERFQDNAIKEHSAQGRASLRGMPTVVLVNRGSASASEIVAGALQDHDLATIVGTQTFGKGTVQEYRQLRDGSAIKVTIAEWLSPRGQSITEAGITPAVTVAVDYDELTEGEDPVLERALELLR